jgi:hypothetical protein
VRASKRAVDSVIYATYCSQPVVLFYAFLLRSSFDDREFEIDDRFAIRDCWPCQEVGCEL